MSTTLALRPHRATWLQRLIPATLGAACLFGVITAFAQPAHLENGANLVADIIHDQSLGNFTGTIGGETVFLNRYGGSWSTPGDLSFIQFAGAGQPAANYTTCAPFVTRLLLASYDWDWTQHPVLDPLTNQPVNPASPKSYLYVAAIKQLVGFEQQLTHFAEVQPGDIAARWDVGTDEGHTMIVVAVSQASAKTYPLSSTSEHFIPALAGATYYEVTVLDSSSSGHSNDTRLITYNGKTALSGGAGLGVIGVFTNASGEIIAHTWSLPTSNYLTTSKSGVTSVSGGWLSGIKSRLRWQAECELVVGRLPALNGTLY